VKKPSRSRNPGKQLAQEMLPDRGDMTKIVGDPTHRSLGMYSKVSPANASGAKQGKMKITRF
jgi:hypothetical protein